MLVGTSQPRAAAGTAGAAAACAREHARQRARINTRGSGCSRGGSSLRARRACSGGHAAVCGMGWCAGVVRSLQVSQLAQQVPAAHVRCAQVLLRPQPPSQRRPKIRCEDVKDVKCTFVKAPPYLARACWVWHPCALSTSRTQHSAPCARQQAEPPRAPTCARVRAYAWVGALGWHKIRARARTHT